MQRKLYKIIDHKKYIKANSFNNEASANRLVNELREKGYSARKQKAKIEGTNRFIWHVYSRKTGV